MAPGWVPGTNLPGLYIHEYIVPGIFIHVEKKVEFIITRYQGIVFASRRAGVA